MKTGTRQLTLAEAMVEAMTATEPIPELLLQSLGPVAEGEQILDTLPEDLQRLWALRVELTLALKAKVDLLKGEGEEKLEELKPLMREKDKLEPLDKLFWASTRDFVGYEHPTIGLRQNWQIVAVPESKEEECDCPVCQMGRHGVITVPLSALFGLGIPIPHRR